ncbi:MAG: HD domain-containing protein [Lachnospiraceae bacterium]|nr:HD domain-containing protein [Lachnospiraceae bacterium]
MKYIETLREGERVSEVYLCKQKQTCLTKAGKPYDSLILQDKTGMLDAKIWDVNSGGIEEFDALDYVYVMGDITSFQGKPQMNVKRVKRVEEGSVNPSDYLPVSEKDIPQMYGQLTAYIGQIKSPHLKQLAESFFDDEEFAKRFQSHSAAKMVHHGFVGGLVEHTLNVTQTCDFFCRQYPMLNRDLLLAAAMFHDIGKLRELSDFPQNDYTDDGQLMGHIVIGAMEVERHIEAISGFPEQTASELIHCILSHHGELEYGSPKKPALIEAVALSFADNADAKLETMKEALAAVPEGSTEWLGYNRFVESNIRRTGKIKD